MCVVTAGSVCACTLRTSSMCTMTFLATRFAFEWMMQRLGLRPPVSSVHSSFKSHLLVRTSNENFQRCEIICIYQQVIDETAPTNTQTHIIYDEAFLMPPKLSNLACQASEDGGSTWADLTQIMTGVQASDGSVEFSLRIIPGILFKLFVAETNELYAEDKCWDMHTPQRLIQSDLKRTI